MKIVYIIMLFVNIVTFVIFGYDKRQALRSGWRIPERTLILWAALSGAFGALLGMRVFHHKTKKKKFYITVPVLAFLWAVLIVLSFIYPVFPVF